MNVAFQLNQLGIPVGMISKVGADFLGDEILDFLKSKRVPVGFVQRDPHHQTGIVKVSLDQKGHPQYEIVENVAWDFIDADEAILEEVRKSSTFVYGSLASRNEQSKRTLMQFLEYAPFKVFDVNLRKPFYSKSLLSELLLEANVIKMNDDELEMLAGWFGLSGTQKEKMEGLKAAFQVEICVVTLGEKGALCLEDSGFYEHPGFRVQVNDTVGSGDAFLAGFISQFLQQKEPTECLEFACKMGAYVATQKGGTPNLEQRTINELFLKI